MKLVGNFILLDKKALVARRAMKAGKTVIESYSVNSARPTRQASLRELLFASATGFIFLLVAIFLSYKIAAYCAQGFAQEVLKWANLHLDSLLWEITFGGVAVAFGVGVFFGSFASLMWLAERAKDFLVKKVFKKSGTRLSHES